MSPNSEKQLLRKYSNDAWVEYMRAVYNGGNVVVWDDFLEVDEYRKAFKEYFGSLDFFSQKNYLNIGVGYRDKIHDVLKESGANITNVDISPDVVKYWQERGEKVLLADAFHLPLIDNSVDGIISTNLINTSATMNAEDLLELFQEFRRVIKKKGHFIQSHFGFYTASNIPRHYQMEALKKSGFQKIQCIENQSNRHIMALQGVSFISEKR